MEPVELAKRLKAYTEPSEGDALCVDSSTSGSSSEEEMEDQAPCTRSAIARTFGLVAVVAVISASLALATRAGVLSPRLPRAMVSRRPAAGALMHGGSADASGVELAMPTADAMHPASNTSGAEVALPTSDAMHAAGDASGVEVVLPAADAMHADGDASGVEVVLPTADAMPAANDGELLLWAQDCWEACGGAGECAQCGSSAACCRHDATDDPEICSRVTSWPALTYHTCAPVAAAALATTEDLGAQASALPRAAVDVSKPPNRALDYNGAAWPTMTFTGTQELHIFVIGDWGGMDGGVITQVRPKKEYRRIIQYKGGDAPGPHVMARSRMGCNFANLVECFNTEGAVGFNLGKSCLPACGWTKGIDDHAQLLVANAFKSRAAVKDPQFILNVGDNFYWGGIETDCGTPMGVISPVAKQQFDDVFERVYYGPGLDGKKWISVLGNHDWGGRYFNAGWDQQIAYTWASNRWVLPAAYYSQHVEYPDHGFSMDIFMIDSNVFDAKELNMDSEHNICGSMHTPQHASCSMQGGPPSLAQCRSWFQAFWREQQAWLEHKLPQSTADWQVVVTHFPCGHDSDWYRNLHQHSGLDLLVTGHRHEQELWSNSLQLGGLTCMISGGGGGITSEASPMGHPKSSSQYGFFDLTISKAEINIELINWEGRTLSSASVQPKAVR